MKTLVPRHPWTLGDNAPTKRLDSGLALIHVQRDHRETVPILEPQVRRSCPRSCRGHRVRAFGPKSSAATARLISKSETRPCAAWGTALQCMPRTRQHEECPSRCRGYGRRGTGAAFFRIGRVSEAAAQDAAASARFGPHAPLIPAIPRGPLKNAVRDNKRLVLTGPGPSGAA